MTAWTRTIPFGSEEHRVFRSDEPVTAHHLDRMCDEGVTMVELSRNAVRGRDPERLSFLSELPGLIGVELYDSGAARIPDEVLARLRCLGLFGGTSIRILPEKAPRLEVFGGSAERLRAGRFGPSLQRLLVTRWKDSDLSEIPVGDGLEDLEVTGIGQLISMVGIDMPSLRRLEVSNVEIDSLNGLQDLRRVDRVGIHPKSSPSVLRDIDVSPLADATELRSLVVGLQGRLTNLDRIASLPRLEQVLAFESFMPEEYRLESWARTVPDTHEVHALVGGPE